MKINTVNATFPFYNKYDPAPAPAGSTRAVIIVTMAGEYGPEMVHLQGEIDVMPSLEMACAALQHEWVHTSAYAEVAISNMVKLNELHNGEWVDLAPTVGTPHTWEVQADGTLEPVWR